MGDLFDFVTAWVRVTTLWRVVTESNEIKTKEETLKASFAVDARMDLAAARIEPTTHLVEMANARLLPSFIDWLPATEHRRWFDNKLARDDKQSRLAEWANEKEALWTSLSQAEQTELVGRVVNAKVALYRRTINDSETAMVLANLVGRRLKSTPPYSLSELAEDVRFGEELDDGIERPPKGERSKDGEIQATRGRVQRIVRRLEDYDICELRRNDAGRPYAVEASELLMDLTTKYFGPEMDRILRELGHGGSK